VGLKQGENMDFKTQKPFENPAPDVYLGTIIDVYPKPNVPSTYNGVTTLQDKVVIVWVLGNLNNSPLVNSEGKPFTVRETHNAKWHENGNLYKRVQMILNQAPPQIKNDAELSMMLIGRTAKLYLISNPNPKKPEQPFINIQGSSPLKPGEIPPPVPQGYVRVALRPPKQAFGQAAPQAPAPYGAPAPAQPAAYTPPVAPAPAPAGSPSPAPQSNNNVQF